MTTEFDSDYTHYQSDRSAIRKWVRRAYLRSAARQLSGPTLDFGCGIGELLEKLSPGSKGLEYNPATVEWCRRKGMDVEVYDGFADDWRLSVLASGRSFESMIVSHVLEHLDEPAAILKRLMLASERLGVRRFLAIVPGKAGFRIDATHRTFVDVALLSDPDIVAGTGFVLHEAGYFPGNLRVIGDWFPHHELQALYVRQ